jgi:Fe-S-cluster containining protein
VTTPHPGFDQSTLCLACGFCCDGTLHTNTILLAEEVDAATELRLAVGVVQDRPAFRQPCTMFREGSCSIYERRPLVCRRYECALLKRTMGGEISLEQALRVVSIAQKQLGVFRSRFPAAISFMRFLRELETNADTEPYTDQAQSGVLEAAASNHIVALVVYLTRHFGDDDGVDESAPSPAPLFRV